MTLVVSKIIDGKFNNISDSLIMDKDILTQTYNPNKNPFASILKTVILSRCVCVSYAGNVYSADQCLKKILEKEQYTWSELQDILVKTSKSHTKSEDRVDFALAFIDKNGETVQAKISNGEIIDHTNSLLWLGNSMAFQKFEKKFNELISSGTNESESMMHAFKAVIDDKTIKSVDHFQIRVTSKEETLTNKKSSFTETIFNYTELLNAELNKDITFHTKPNQFTSLPLDPEKDLIGISLFVTRSPYKFGIAVYSISEGKGVLLCPQLKLGLEIYEFKEQPYQVVKGQLIESNYQNFIDEIYKKHKLPMTGLIWSSDSWGVKQINNFDSDIDDRY